MSCAMSVSTKIPDIYVQLNLLKIMKKFNDFQKSEGVLSKEQMNKIKGGVCYYITTSGEIRKGSKEAVLHDFAIDGRNWCCDSCSSATWMPKNLALSVADNAMLADF